MILNWNIINYGIQNVAAKIFYPNIYQENKLVFARWSFASWWIVINCIKCQEHTIYGCFSLHYIILKMVNIRACINSSWPATISLVSSSKSKPKIRTTTHASGSVLSEKKTWIQPSKPLQSHQILTLALWNFQHRKVRNINLPGDQCGWDKEGLYHKL